MELPIELVQQHDEAVAREAEAEQWAYAVAYALVMRKKYPRLKHELDKQALVLYYETHMLSLNQVKLMAASAARRGDKLRTSGLVRAVAKRIIGGNA